MAGDGEGLGGLGRAELKNASAQCLPKTRCNAR